MAEAIWYFADGEEERGPVTEAQIRTLIGTNNLTREDLVWREGMEDWVPAGEIPGLFDSAPVPAAPAPAVEPGGKPAPVKQEPRAASRRATPSDERLPSRASRVFRPRQTQELVARLQFLGKPLLIVGFVAVLTSRGCEDLARRNAERLGAKAEIAQRQFEDRWQAEQAALEKQRREFSQKGNLSPVDQRMLESLDQKLRDLERKKAEDEETLRTGKWQEMSNAAKAARAENAVWDFWRGCLFWMGTTVFCVGLLVVGFRGQGPERWMGLAMLAVVVFRLYSSGIP
jgi:hypothetical protein